MPEDLPSLDVSVIVPVYNEEESLPHLVEELHRALSPTGRSYELVLVDDGSKDGSWPLLERLAESDPALNLVRFRRNFGQTAAMQAGLDAARGACVVTIDADLQNDPADIPALLAKLDEGYDMVVGARGAGGQANVGRGLANRFYNRLATWMTGHRIADLTSGFRVARAERFRQFLHLLPNGFSYPTTSTMAFFRSAYPVAYVPIPVAARIGKSHIRPVRDGLRFLLIIFRIATLYSPVKLFAPTSAGFFLIGLGYYVWTFTTQGRLTNMSTLLFSAAVIVFLIGLVSEQITNLMYRRDD